MRILFLSEQFPFPLHDGGNLRTFHILRGLASAHEVWLLSQEMRSGGKAPQSALDGVRRVVTVKESPVWKRLLSNSLRPKISGRSLYILKNWSQPLLRAADRLLASENFDAIHFNSVDAACFTLARRWPQLKVYDTHNCFSSIMEQAGLRSRSRLMRRIYLREAEQLRRLEGAICDRMNATLVCSEDDAARFLSLGRNERVTIVPNGVDTEFFGEQPQVAEQPGALVFTGAMSYFPNDEAVRHFARAVMPRLADIDPPARLFVVGKNPSPAVAELHDGRSYVVTGEVDDVRPYLAQAQVVVVPLLTGGGTRLKILEAFAMGKAVVSTPRGAEGIPAEDGREILLADDAESFARHVRRLLRSAELRGELGRAAHRFVREHFDWRAIHRTLLNVYEQCAGRRCN